MAFFATTLLLILQWLNYTNCLPTNAQQPFSITGIPHRLRPVVEDDLDDFTTVYIDAFRPGPMWQYTHFSNFKDANYTWTCTRAALEEQIDRLHRNRTFINVITVPHSHKYSDERRERVVSLAVWNWILPGEHLVEEALPMATTSLSSAGGPDCAAHLDTNMTRMGDLINQSNRLMSPFLNSTQTQLYLNLLATHPDWDGNGFGAEQLAVGMKMAADEQVPSTLFATPAGWPLYDSLGFGSLANLTITKLDGLGELWLEYMRKDVE